MESLLSGPPDDCPILQAEPLEEHLGAGEEKQLSGDPALVPARANTSQVSHCSESPFPSPSKGVTRHLTYCQRLLESQEGVALVDSV